MRTQSRGSSNIRPSAWALITTSTIPAKHPNAYHRVSEDPVCSTAEKERKRDPKIRAVTTSPTIPSSAMTVTNPE